MNKLIISLSCVIIFTSTAVMAGSNGFTTYSIVSSAVTSLTNYDATKRNIKCLVGPVEGNPVRFTKSSVSTNPTTTIGHSLAVGASIAIEKSTTYDGAFSTTTARDEVSTFRAISTTGTATVPCTCN